MKIGVDLDDTLCQTIKAIFEFHNNKHGTNFDVKDAKTYDIYDIWGDTREKIAKELREYHTSDYAKNAKPIPHAKKILNKLKMNNELFIITARSNEIKKETEEWVETFFPNIFSEIHYARQFIKDEEETTSKKTICDNLNIDILIEDSLKYATECEASCKKIFLIDNVWNQTDKMPPNIKRVHSWKEINIK